MKSTMGGWQQVGAGESPFVKLRQREAGARLGDWADSSHRKECLALGAMSDSRCLNVPAVPCAGEISNTHPEKGTEDHKNTTLLTGGNEEESDYLESTRAACSHRILRQRNHLFLHKLQRSQEARILIWDYKCHVYHTAMRKWLLMTLLISTERRNVTGTRKGHYSKVQLITPTILPLSIKDSLLSIGVLIPAGNRLQQRQGDDLQQQAMAVPLALACTDPASFLVGLPISVNFQKPTSLQDTAVCEVTTSGLSCEGTFSTHCTQANFVNRALFQGILNWDIIGNLQYALQWLAMLIIVVQQEKAASLLNRIKSEGLSVKLYLWNVLGVGRDLPRSRWNWLHKSLSVGFYLTSFIYMALNYVIQ